MVFGLLIAACGGSDTAEEAEVVEEAPAETLESPATTAAPTASPTAAQTAVPTLAPVVAQAQPPIQLQCPDTCGIHADMDDLRNQISFIQHRER